MRANLLAVVLSLVSLSLAADCSVKQPRKEGDPPGQKIAKAIGSQQELDRVCSGSWRDGDEKKLETSLNHWAVIYKISRTDSKHDLKHCKKALKNIIEQCVSGASYWGGSWSLEGETYSISNSVFPNNPLAPYDDGDPQQHTSVSTKATYASSKSTAHTSSSKPSSHTSSSKPSSHTSSSKPSSHTSSSKPSSQTSSKPSSHTLSKSSVATKSTITSSLVSSKFSAASKSTNSRSTHSRSASSKSMSTKSSATSKASATSKSSATSRSSSKSSATGKSSATSKSSVSAKSSAASKSTIVSSRSSASSKSIRPSTKSASRGLPISTKSDLGAAPPSKSPTPAKPTGPGRITSAAQPSAVRSGQYSTTTQSISGLTANSATKTNRNGYPTELPIWCAGPGVGIMVLPMAGVPAGAPVPPPVGYPPLSVGADGKPTPKKDDPPSKVTSQHNKPSGKPQSTQGGDRETKTESKSGHLSKPSTAQEHRTTSKSGFSTRPSTATNSRTTNSISSIVNIIPEPADKFPPIVPIIPGDKTPTSLITSATQRPTAPGQPPPSPPKVSARPIGAPICVPVNVDGKKEIPPILNGTNADVRDLLHRMRQEACGGTCSFAGQGIPGDTTNVLNNNGECEIRVGITDSIEAYMFRATPATGDQQQQCWDSLETIVSKCVDGTLSGTWRKGWWNGDHQYQFYEAGLRPLNDGSAKSNAKLTKWLGGRSCKTDCPPFRAPDHEWCAKNCEKGGKMPGPIGSLFGQPITTTHFRSRRNMLSSLFARAGRME